MDAWPGQLGLLRHPARGVGGQTPDVQLISELTGALQNTASNDPPFFDNSTMAQIYREGTEMGLLGLHSSAHHIYATDWSLEEERMGAGVFIVRSGKDLRCRERISAVGTAP